MAGIDNLTHKGKGRVKGVPNKVTTSMRDAFREAFDQLGGAAALAEWGVANKTEFYKLTSKLIPLQIQGDVKAAIEIVHRSE